MLFDCLLTVLGCFLRLVHCWYTVGTVLVDLWWLVAYTHGHFCAVLTVFCLFLTIGTLLVHCWYSLGRHVMIGTPIVIFVLFWLCFVCFWWLVHCWYSLGRPVTIVTPIVIFVVWLSWLFCAVFLRLVHCWYSLGRHVMIGTPIVIFCCFDFLLTVFDSLWRLVHRWYTVGTVLVDLWRLVMVHQWFWVFLTIGTVCHSSKTVKRQDSQNSKNYNWCTNRHVY